MRKPTPPPSLTLPSDPSPEVKHGRTHYRAFFMEGANMLGSKFVDTYRESFTYAEDHPTANRIHLVRMGVKENRQLNWNEITKMGQTNVPDMAFCREWFGGEKGVAPGKAGGTWSKWKDDKQSKRQTKDPMLPLGKMSMKVFVLKRKVIATLAESYRCNTCTLQTIVLARNAQEARSIAYTEFQTEGRWDYPVWQDYTLTSCTELKPGGKKAQVICVQEAAVR